MPRILRFAAVLVLGLALLVYVGHLVLAHQTRAWFESDVALRAKLAVASAQQTLSTHWNDNRAQLRAGLADIARDRRIMGAAACNADGTLVTATEAFPPVLTCEHILAQMALAGQPEQWTATEELASGRVHVSATSLQLDAATTGVIVLAHDLSFVARREASTRNFLLVGFIVLALGAAAVTFLAARFVWRGWTERLQQALVSPAAPADQSFLPLLRDVRQLVDDLVKDAQAEARHGVWDPVRLRVTLNQHLQGERIVVLANRAPYLHERRGDRVEVLHPASGLVTALEPVMRACSGVWVAHGAGSADRETVDSHDRVMVPPGEESYALRRVWLSEAEEQGYYYGLANEGLWPMCHVAHTRPVFRAEDWAHYVAVNQRFADAVCQEVDSDAPVILVQDYHFALAPRLIRAKLPKATILTFWHIPWPSAERVGICPWREELVAGLLGSSIIGFHTQQYCNNFFESVDAFLERRIDREQNAVVQGARRTMVRPYPISIEWPVRWMENVASVQECRRSVREELGLAPDALLGVGIDRLDYTKGVEERLLAVDTLLRRFPEYRGKFSFVQLAAPSRTKLDKYRELNERVERLTEEINARWGDPTSEDEGVVATGEREAYGRRAKGYRPIVLLRAHHEPREVFRYYRAAELCYVSSLHDGMNLVAKEFVAARDDLRGVLLLSEFTGAARDLTEALIVNPYDLQDASNALAAALQMPETEQAVRMRSMRRLVAEFNVYRWAGRMLVDAAELRRREQLSGRLTSREHGNREATSPGIA